STGTPTRGGGLPRTPNSNPPCRPSCTARSTPPISRCPSCHDKGRGARVDGGCYPCNSEPLGNGEIHSDLQSVPTMLAFDPSQRPPLIFSRVKTHCFCTEIIRVLQRNFYR